MMQDFPIVGSFNSQRYSPMDAERSINLFEYIDPSDKKPGTLLSTSGIMDINLDFLPENGPSRASFVYKQAVYQVFGETLFRISGNSGSLLVQKLGSFATDNGYVGIDANSFQLIVVDGTNGFIFDTNTNQYIKITDTSFPKKPIDVCYLDGYFIVADGDTNNFYVSLFNNGLVWGPSTTDFTVNTTIPAEANYFTLAQGNENFQTGVPFQFTVTLPAVLPTTSPQIDTTNTFYAIIDPSTNNRIKVATSAENAYNGNFVTVSAVGAPPYQIVGLGQLQVASITSHPGTIVACRTLHRRLFLFSQNYTEVWENAGIGGNLPFRRNNSLLMEVGTPAIGSVSVGFDMLFFLSQDRDGLGSVMKVTGTESIPISIRALDYDLAQFSSRSISGSDAISDARGILIKENGLIFYRLNFTTSNHTYVYNDSMSSPESYKWHEEEVLNGDRHPAQTHFFYNGKNYYGDYKASKVYVVDPRNPTNNGEAIRRCRISRPIVPAGYNRTRVDRFHLDVVQGSVSEDLMLSGSSPIIFMSLSKDGGQSYGYEMQSNMGAIGERTFRSVWRKLGTTPRGQAFVTKIQFFNDVPFIILGAAWAFEIMPE